MSFLISPCKKGAHPAKLLLPIASAFDLAICTSVRIRVTGNALLFRTESLLIPGSIEVRPSYPDLNFFGLTLVYTKNGGRKMNNCIENNDDQFANGQVGRDLRGDSDGAESETQLDAVKVVEQRPDVAPEEFPAPVGRLLGLMITSSGAGRATVEFEASGRYANPMGTLHGGVLCDLADAAMGVAYLSTLPRGETFTPIELKINFLRPVWKGKIRAQPIMISSR